MHEHVALRLRLVLEAGEDKSLKNAQAVEAYYRNHDDHIQAKQEMIEAEYQANIAGAACFAMRQKKDMLENLSRLALADYFARPTEPRDLPGEAEKRKEGRQTAVREKAVEKLSRRSRQ